MTSKIKKKKKKQLGADQLVKRWGAKMVETDRVTSQTAKDESSKMSKASSLREDELRLVNEQGEETGEAH